MKRAGLALDERMPGLTGSEVCARLAGNKETAAIPVIILTGYPSTPAIAGNVHHVIRKPFSTQQVVDAVAKLVEVSVAA